MNSSSERIVVGIDGSEGAAAALAWAVRQAARGDSTLEVVYAWTDDSVRTPASAIAASVDDAKHDAESELDRLVDAAEIPADVRVDRRAIHGQATAVLVDRATAADLLVVGSRGRGAVAGLLLGSVSQQLVQQSRCPVVVVPSTTK